MESPACGGRHFAGVLRIYRELGLQLRNKTPKRRVRAKLRDDRRPATRSNETWAMDFVHDQLATGHKLRVLTIVDIFSRFSPAQAPRLSFRGTDVVAILERVCNEVGFPATIRDRSRQRVRVQGS
jgi:putative transposase